MGDDALMRVWRRVWRNQRHPKVREERFKAAAAACNGAGLALILGALAGPLLNPAQQPDILVRIGLGIAGAVLILAAQALLGYIVIEERDDAR